MTSTSQHDPKSSFMPHAPFGLVSLLFANLLTLGLFIVSDGSILQVLWSFWLQSIIIGVINIFRIYILPMQGRLTFGTQGGFSDKGIPTFTSRFLLASFFTFHYGFFHLVYAVFLGAYSVMFMSGDLASTMDVGTVSIGAVLLSGLAFALHHLLSFGAEYRYIKRHSDRAPAIKSVFFRPYLRIIPMHLIIIAGPWIAYWLGGIASVFVVFMLLKTAADVALYTQSTSHPAKKL